MQDKKKFYEAKWFLWLFLILFPPIGIILLWVVHKDMKKNKKIILSVIFVIWFIILMAATSGDDTSTDNQQETTKVEETSSESITKASQEIIEQGVKEAIKGDIDSKDESIKEVVLKNGELFVYVDISKADPTPLTLEDLALSRTSSITDSILDLTEYYDSWNTITVDFGNIGKITNTKDDVEKNEFGFRYFPQENFVLE